MNFGYGANDRRDGVLSVAEVNRYVKLLMDNDALLSTICVCGEISNLKYHTSGHIYFTLKDEEAEISAVMFRSSVNNMKFIAKNGMKVRAYGKISLYEKGGKCQIYVSAMLDDGIGALQIEYEKLRKKLSDEGLFDKERKKSLPRFPSCVGIITSPTGAAVRDMINVSTRRWPAANILIYPALVQGIDAPMSLCRGIELLNAYAVCDVIIIGRGGGSIEDLWAFNDERVVRAVASSHIPTISAVGHETDFTLCDFAADCRAPTPSAAAEIALPDKEEYRQRIDEILDKIDLATSNLIKTKKNLLSSFYRQLELSSPQTRLMSEKKLLEQKTAALDRLIDSIYQKRRDDLGAIAGKLFAMSPLAVLSRGYSLTQNEEGQVITSSSLLSIGETVELTFAKGGALAVISEIKE